MTPQEIKTLRQSLNLSQTKFGMLVGVAMRTVQDWESGKRNPGGPARMAMERLQQKLTEGEKKMGNMIEKSEENFSKLSKKQQSAICKKAKKYIAENPGCADHNGFWERLSARSITYCFYRNWNA